MLIETVSIVFLYFFMQNEGQIENLDKYAADLKNIANFAH